jgi:hypothetical protein
LLLYRVQLIETVDLHELNACGLKNLCARNFGEDSLERAVRARIAIMPRIFEQRAVAVEQPEIHAPGIHADAVQLVAFRRGESQAFADFVKKPQRVPVETRRQAHRRIRKTVNFAELEPVLREPADHRTAALCSQIQSQITTGHFEASISSRCRFSSLSLTRSPRLAQDKRNDPHRSGGLGL